MTTTEKPKPRFDIHYDSKNRHNERLTIKCNYPELEVGAPRIMRTYTQDRARVKWKRILQLAEMPPENMNRWIVNVCGIGSPALLQENQPQQQVMVAPSVDQVMAELGRMLEIV